MEMNDNWEEISNLPIQRCVMESVNTKDSKTEKDSKLLDIFLHHQDKCWNEFLHFKETKDKIVYFIGTLFITSLFSSTLLIYKAQNNIALVQDLYKTQILTTHILFLVLYLYYKYNSLKEKVYLCEVQSIQTRIIALEPLKAAIPVPFCSIKSNYIEDNEKQYKFSGDFYKDVANVSLIVIYIIFTFIPVFSKNLIIFRDGGLFINYLALGCAIVLISVLFIVNHSSIKITCKIRKEISRNWENHNVIVEASKN